MSDWRDRIRTALAERGCATQAEWVERFPGEHCWFVFDEKRPWESCASCDVVRRKDDKNKPCRGIVTIVLREAKP